MKTAAAIRRASQQARNAMRDLDVNTIADLVELYEDTAAQVRGAIAQRLDHADTVPREHLQALLRQIEDILEALGRARDALLIDRLGDAAALGVRPYMAQGMAAAGGGGTAQAVLDSGAAMRVSQEAVRFVQGFQAVDGLTLSDRLWRLDQGAKEALQRAIGNAVVQGWSASRAAAELAYNGQAVPPMVARQLTGARGPALARLADLLTSGDGAEVWKAERVFRTEINRAHGEAYMAGAEQTPGFAGFRFLLSPAHPEPDICDLLAAQNLHGLGQGVYPDRARTPWPAHPNTLSFVQIVFEDEITDADRAGKETELQALGRLAPEIRAGVLGQTKAAYFDAGLLRSKGMIRAPLRAVRDRLQRQDAQHPRALPGADRIVIPLEKITRYSLNPDHPTGGQKARVFAALGFTQENSQALVDAITKNVKLHRVEPRHVDHHGARFRVDIPVTGPAGNGMIRTGWIQRPGEAGPQLTTVYVIEKPKSRL